MIGRKLLCVLAILPLVFGCGKPTTSPPAVSTISVPGKVALPASAVRIHWLGKKKIGSDPNAKTLRQIWDLPESVKLEAQTLDKLSVAPWRVFLGQTNQAQANLLRPLLEDAVANEGYLEIRKSTNTPNATEEIVFAVQLDKERISLWQTNLAAVVQSLTGSSPQAVSDSRWSLKNSKSPNLIDCAHSGNWFVLGIAQDHNLSFDESLARIERQHTPVVEATKAWIEGNVDLSRLYSWIEPGANKTLPKASFSVTGDGTNVITQGELDFASITLPEPEPWNLPTNLIGSNFVAFTAVRGIKPVLQSSETWAGLKAGPPPDQFYVWALESFPMETYFAAPLTDASNAVSRIRDWVLQRGQSPLASNPWANFENSRKFNGLSWHGIPFFTPFLQSVTTNNGNFAFGGFFTPDPTAGSPPPELSTAILADTNLVYYDWDLTGPRLEELIQLGQAIRLAWGAPQLSGNSASFGWIKALIPRTAVCGTRVVRIGPDRMSFWRKSTVGLSAVELHLLADWLESQEFPRGAYSDSPQPTAY